MWRDAGFALEPKRTRTLRGLHSDRRHRSRQSVSHEGRGDPARRHRRLCAKGMEALGVTAAGSRSTGIWAGSRSRRSAAATKDIEQKMSARPAAATRAQDNAGTNKPAGTSSGGSGAMERLGGGPSGGYDNVPRQSERRAVRASRRRPARPSSRQPQRQRSLRRPRHPAAGPSASAAAVAVAPIVDSGLLQPAPPKPLYVR